MNKIDIGINSLSYLIAISQVENVLRIIGLVVSVIGTLVLTIFKFLDWYKKAKADGEITKEEIDEGVKIITDAKEEIDKHKGEKL